MNRPDETAPDPAEAAADPADTLSPFRQAQVVLNHLSPRQVTAYCRSSGLPESTSRERAAVHWAEHRVRALQEAALVREQVEARSRTTKGHRPGDVSALPDEADRELAETTAVRDQAARQWSWVRTQLLRIGFVTGLLFLVFGIVGIFVAPLLVVAGVCMVVSFLSLFVLSSAAEAAGYRRARAALLDWAVARPGQLERGLPGLGVRVESRVADALGGCLAMAATGIAMFCAPMVVVLLLVALLDQRATTWQITGITAGVGLMAFLSMRVINARSFWIGWSTRRVDESLAWVYAAAVPDRPTHP